MAIRTEIKSVLSPVITGVLQAAQPSHLFATGEQGVWFDPSDFSTLFQDAAGTTPVTAVGQPVGLMLDKSGRGNHASQSTDGKRPVLEVDTNGRYYLKGNAAEGRYMVTSAITAGSNGVQVFSGVRKLSDTTRAMIVEFGNLAGPQQGMWLLNSPRNDGVANASFASFGSTGTAVRDAIATSVAAPRTDVLTGIGSIPEDQSILRINGVQSAINTSDQGTGNYGSYSLYLFARIGSTLYFDGRIYGLIVRFGPNLNAVTIMDIERYMAGKTGIMF